MKRRTALWLLWGLGTVAYGAAVLMLATWPDFTFVASIIAFGTGSLVIGTTPLVFGTTPEPTAPAECPMAPPTRGERS